jgi:hypothetical protein
MLSGVSKMMGGRCWMECTFRSRERRRACMTVLCIAIYVDDCVTIESTKCNVVRIVMA